MCDTTDDVSRIGVISRKTATIPQFVDYSGIGRSKIYELLKHGVLESIRVGSRQLILLESYDRLIDAQRAVRQATSAEPAIKRGPGRPRTVGAGSAAGESTWKHAFEPRPFKRNPGRTPSK
jgi:hypothetical protein